MATSFKSDKKYQFLIVAHVPQPNNEFRRGPETVFSQPESVVILGPTDSCLQCVGGMSPGQKKKGATKAADKRMIF